MMPECREQCVLPAQLTLRLSLHDDARLENFQVSVADVTMMSAISGLFDDERENLFFLHGASGSGKSHLLQACCHLAGESNRTSLYLPGAQIRDYAANEVLEATETLDLVCIDDIQLLTGDPDWDEALFHWLNRARDSGSRLLIAADCSPRELLVTLEDLRSRLAWGTVFKLHGLDDDGKQAMLRLRASRRGLRLEPGVAQYIVSRSSRDMAGLLAVLNVLDEASLAAQRNLSLPFVKETLDW